MMDGAMEGCRVLVTAAGGGIGRACVEQFLRAGADVLAIDISPASLGGLMHARTAVLDGADREALKTFLAGEARFDAVVHCIGIVPTGTVMECTPEVWGAAFRTNVDSFLHLAQAVLPQMVAARSGSLICIASVVSSLKGALERAAYGASKAALIGLVKSIAIDYAASGVRCNAVCPGTVLSPSLQARISDLGERLGAEAALRRFVERQPLGRLGRPEEVAALCLYLASDLGAFVTGQALVVDGGMSL